MRRSPSRSLGRKSVRDAHLGFKWRNAEQQGLTEDDESLLGRVWVDLWFWVVTLPDIVADVSDGAEDGEVREAPCPLERPAQLARLLGRGRRRVGVLVSLELERDRSYPAAEGWSVGRGGGSGSGTGGEGSARRVQEARRDCRVLLQARSGSELARRELA